MSQKRKQINIEEKSRIISKLEKGIPNKDLAKEYGVSHSTISSIWKEREKIQILYDKNFLKMKRARTTRHTKIEEALLKWFKYQRTNNVPINGPILQQKANDFAQRFGEDFVCSSSWIQRFRARHGIVGGKMSGEAASVDKDTVDEWITQKWPTLCEGYSPEDIYNADETGLFYNMTPDRTLKFKGENCSGGKMSKTRLTIMVAANMTGSCKRKLLVIGKSKKPRCFKNIRSLPVTYENNVKSWMTSEIFERWLRNWDAELKANNKKVLLLVDNCPAHPAVTSLKCIKLVFLPPNVTSVLQPMDQGVIRCLKSHYRRLQVLKLIQSIDSNNQNSFTVLDAILMISEAWEKVSQKTVANCFRHAGFKDLTSLITRTSDDVIDDDEEDNISLAQLAQNLRPALSTTETDEFIDVDQSIAICAPATEDDIVREVQEENENEQEDSEEQFTVPTLIDGLNAVSVLRKIVLFNEEFHMQGNCDDTLIKIQRELQNVYARQKCFKQTKITDFMHTKMMEK